MHWTSKLLPCLAICLTSISVNPQQARAKEEGEPQMVWVNYAEGEVKLSPGHNGEVKLGKDWIEANRGQVMEDGYTLVTEKGRAEIEFEDGTVVYLAENSALEFAWLWVTEKGATKTELNLLTGTATIAHTSHDEVDLETPVMRMRFLGIDTTRVECALNAVVIRSLEGSILGSEGITRLAAGESAAYVGGKLIALKGMEQTMDEDELSKWGVRTVRQREIDQPAEGDEWDQWVAGRMATRQALVAEGLKESGLKEPIPGLAGMVEGGRFFDCPQGRCWGTSERAGQAAMAAPAAATATARPTIVVNQTMLTRCPMEAWQVAAGGTVTQYGTCLAGTWNDPQWGPNDPCRRWDPARKMYVYWAGCDVYPTWVAGRRHHHSCHFVKTGHHRVGIVPRHPQDQIGHRLLNAKSGILVLATEKGKLQAGVQPVPSKGVHVVEGVPRGMERGVERAVMENAPRVTQPVIEMKLAEAILPRGVLGAGHAEGQKSVTTIRLDYKTGNFVGRSTTGGTSHGVVMAHVGGGGAGMGGHAGSGGGGGGSHGSSGGGGGHSGGGGTSGGSSPGAGGGGGGHH
jgi:FecR protein